MIDADTLLQVLQAKAETLQAALQAKVDANLSGGVLQARSGRLKAAALAELEADGDGFILSLGASDVPYAAIQEHGGQTPAHDIVPVKARALHFAGLGASVFARRVHHPGSVIPGRAPFGRALDDAQAGAIGELKVAIRDALDAN